MIWKIRENQGSLVGKKKIEEAVGKKRKLKEASLETKKKDENEKSYATHEETFNNAGSK